MADTSKREQIIVATQTLVESLESIKTTVRTIPEYSDLQDYALTQLPVAAIVGRLPQPTEKNSGRRSAEVLQIKSRLIIDLFIYFEANVNADSEVSRLLNDLWVVLYQDQSRGGLVLDTKITAQEDTQRWAPFVAFKISCIHNYIHDTGGI